MQNRIVGVGWIRTRTSAGENRGRNPGTLWIVDPATIRRRDSSFYLIDPYLLLPSVANTRISFQS